MFTALTSSHEHGFQDWFNRTPEKPSKKHTNVLEEQLQRFTLKQRRTYSFVYTEVIWVFKDIWGRTMSQNSNKHLILSLVTGSINAGADRLDHLSLSHNVRSWSRSRVDIQSHSGTQLFILIWTFVKCAARNRHTAPHWVRVDSCMLESEALLVFFVLFFSSLQPSHPAVRLWSR